MGYWSRVDAEMTYNGLSQEEAELLVQSGMDTFGRIKLILAIKESEKNESKT